MVCRMESARDAIPDPEPRPPGPRMGRSACAPPASGGIVAVPASLQPLLGDDRTANSGWLSGVAAQQIVLQERFHSLRFPQ